MRNKLFKAIAPPLIVLVLATLSWELFARWYAASATGYRLPLPSPLGMAHAIAHQPAEMLSALATTTQGALLGFAASGIIGCLAAIVLSSSTWVRRAVYPYTLFFQTVPVIAIAPMLEIWSGAGLRAVVIIAFIVSVFPVIAATLQGLLSTDPALEDLFKLYHAGPLARLFKLRLPTALPSLLVGLRVAAGLSVIGAVVAEFFVGSYGPTAGLGVKIVSDAKYGHTDAVFAAVLLASLLGLGLFACVNFTGWALLRRRRTGES